MTAKIKKIKILHFASFTGNIGDNLNHSGLYKSLDKELGKKLHHTQGRNKGILLEE